MATKDEVQAALEALDARAEAWRARLEAGESAALPEGDWTVRDALCHIAARANPAPLVQGLVARADGSGGGGARMNIDDANAQQISERDGRSVGQIVDEIIAGHAAGVQGLAAFSDADLAQVVKIPFPPGESALGDVLLMAGPGHERSHWDQIEAALS